MQTQQTNPITNIDELFEAVGVNDKTLSRADKENLDKQGFLIIPGLLDKKWLEQLRAAFERLLEEHEKENGQHARQTTGTRHVDNLAAHGKIFEDVFTHPKLLAAARHILGDDLRFGGIHGRDPLPGFGQQGLHSDAPPRQPGTPYLVVTSLWALDDFTVQNGATRLVPGTHTEYGLPPKETRQPGYNHPKQIFAVAPAGSVILFNGHLWHSGTQNHSKGPRRALQCVHVAPGYPYYTSIGENIPEGVGPSARYLMSVNQIVARQNEYWKDYQQVTGKPGKSED
jgi:ectoine hydroxylase-related dioxygenase (phytanoyl-CoA dioxygenase family)